MLQNASIILYGKERKPRWGIHVHAFWVFQLKSGHFVIWAPLEHLGHIPLPGEVFHHCELHIIDVDPLRPAQKKDNPQKYLNQNRSHMQDSWGTIFAYDHMVIQREQRPALWGHLAGQGSESHSPSSSLPWLPHFQGVSDPRSYRW